MDYAALYDSRLQNIKNIVNGEKPNYMPVVSLAQTWAMSYAGTNAKETFTTVEHELDVYGKHIKDLGFDATLLFGMNRPLDLYMSLGYSTFFFSEDGITLQNKDNQVISLEELDEFISDPMKFLRNKVIYRRYPAYRKNVPGAILTSLSKMIAFKKKNDQIPEYLRNNVGAPVLVSSNDLLEPALDRYIGWRSFAEGMIDLRRRPEKVEEALEVTYNQIVAPAEGQRPDFPWAFVPVVSATYLNPRQFERFFWPTFKRMADTVIAGGGKVMVAMEGTWGKAKYEHFNEFPKSSIIVFCEGDDFLEVKKTIGDKVTVCGGLNAQLVREGTPEQNIEYVRRILGEAGTQGMMLAPGKCWLSPNDANAENLRAICDFAHAYAI